MICFIVNPAAGSGKAKAAVPVIERIMRKRGTEYTFIHTNGPGDLKRVSALIDRDLTKTIVCVGGDGTIQEYAGLAAGGNVSFGIIPAGSGNDFIHSMPGGERKFPSFEEKTAFYTEKILIGETANADAVIVNGGRYFLNASGTGIDIQVLKCAVPLKRFFGSAAYFISLAKTAFTYKATEMTLTVDGVSETDKYLLLAVCNGGYIGGKLNIAPPASINDGLITLCKIKSMPRLKLMAMFPLVKWGRHRILKEVSFVNCSSVKLEFKGRRTIHFDGNLFDFESPLTFEIVKNAVKLIV